MGRNGGGRRRAAEVRATLEVHVRLSGVEAPAYPSARRAHRFVAARLRFDTPGPDTRGPDARGPGGAPRPGSPGAVVPAPPQGRVGDADSGGHDPGRRRDPAVTRGATVVPVVSMRWRRSSAVALDGAALVAVRDTVPADVLRIDRSCKVFVLALPDRSATSQADDGPTIELAVRPDDLPAMWAGLRLAGLA